MSFYTVITDTGLAKLAAATAGGDPVVIEQFGVGDGNGSYPTPASSDTALVNELYRGDIKNVYVHPEKDTWVVADGIVPADEGPFTIREVGFYDSDGDLFALGVYPLTYKPAPGEGAPTQVMVSAIMEVSNSGLVEVSVDPNIVQATRGWVDEFYLSLAAAQSLYAQKLWVDEFYLSLTAAAPIFAERVAASITHNITQAEFEALIATIPKNLNGKTVTINVTGSGTQTEFASTVNISHFYGGLLLINFTNCLFKLNAGHLSFYNNRARVNLTMTNSNIYLSGAGTVGVSDCQSMEFEDLTIVPLPGFSAPHTCRTWRSKVSFIGTTSVGGGSGHDSLIAKENSDVYIQLMDLDTKPSSDSFIISDGSKVLNISSSAIVPYDKVVLENGGSFSQKEACHYCTLKVNSNLSFVPRAGRDHFVFDASGTSLQATIRVLAVRDGYIYYQIVSGSIPDDGNTYTIKLMNDSGEPWWAQFIGNAGMTGFVTRQKQPT